MAQFAPTVPRIDSPVFLVLCYDGEDSAGPRQSELDGHLAYVEQHTEQYLVAGPLREAGRKAARWQLFPGRC